MSHRSSSLAGFLRRHQMLILGIAIVFVFALFISRLSTHPGGFYLDESCESYNAYLISQTGTAQNGVTAPVFFQCYNEGFTQWMSPMLIYSMSGMYKIVAPSTLSARIFSASLVFLAALMLGLLAVRLSGRRLVGMIVALMALVTPWLFEISRLVQETSFLAFAIVLFMLCLHNAYRRKEWSIADNLLIGVSLALITYAYAAGRVLAPAFAFGLLIFAVNRRSLLSVVKTWIVYVVALVPFIVVYITKGDVITARFREVTYMTPGSTWGFVASQFFSNLYSDISPVFLLLEGDPIRRHHIPAMGEILVGTFILSLLGIIFIVLRHHRDAWWRFALYGLAVSLLPGLITIHRHHALRLLALPIFLIIFTIPALATLLGVGNNLSESVGSGRGFISKFQSLLATIIPTQLSNIATSKVTGNFVLSVLLILTFVQAGYFQYQFQALGSVRTHEFDASYPKVFERALNDGSRPIYLKDGYWGPASIHAYWYSTIQGVDTSIFVRLKERETPPAGALVLSSDNECSNCEKVFQEGAFLLYRVAGAAPKPPPPGSKPLVPAAQLTNPFNFGEAGSGPGQFSKPRGIAVDTEGNVFVTDSENGRIQKFDRDGKFIATIGTKGPGEGELLEPHGIAVNSLGDIYADDSVSHKLVKFGKDGKFVKEWKGPGFNFYGPRDISIASDGRLYIVDQGNSRIVIFNPSGETFTYWGSPGSGDGQFGDPTGIAIADNNVFVADGGNNRIQVFDLDGKYLRQWAVPEWETAPFHYPDLVLDEQTGCLYVTNLRQNEIMTFDREGAPMVGPKPSTEGFLDGPSSIVMSTTKKSRRLYVLSTVKAAVTVFDLLQQTK